VKIKIRDDLIVEALDIIGLNNDEWRDNIIEKINEGCSLKSGSGIFCTGSVVFYNADYKDIIIENGIIIAKGKK
jgi:hypothetical protein